MRNSTCPLTHRAGGLILMMNSGLRSRPEPVRRSTQGEIPHDIQASFATPDPGPRRRFGVDAPRRRVRRRRRRADQADVGRHRPRRPRPARRGGDDRGADRHRRGAVTDTTEAAAVTTAPRAGKRRRRPGSAKRTGMRSSPPPRRRARSRSTRSQGLDQLNDLGERFNDEYGIELEVVRDIDSELIPKVEAEQQTGSGIADVFAQASAAWSEQRGCRGLVRRARRPGVRRPGVRQGRQRVRRRDVLHVDGRGAHVRLEHRPVPDRARPTTPTCSTPSWPVGRSASSSRAAPSIVDFWLYLEENYGEDFVTQLAAQEPKIYPSSLPMAQALTSGEISAGSFVQVLVDEKEQGAPVDSGLADQVWGARFNTAILKTAPHPNAAQVLANFMITQAGQEAIARKAASVLPDIAGRRDHRRQGPRAGPRQSDARVRGGVPGQVERPVQVAAVRPPTQRSNRGDHVSHVSIQSTDQALRRQAPDQGGRRPRPRDRGGRVPRPPRSERVRQDHHACAASPGWRRRARAGSRFGDDHGVRRRPPGEPVARQAQHRHGVPVVRAVAAHDGAQEHRLPAARPARSRRA